VRSTPPRRAMVRDHRPSPCGFRPSISTPFGPLPVIATRRSGRGLRRTADHLRHRPCRDRPPSSLRPSSRGRWLASSAASDCQAGPTDAAPSAGARSVEPPSCSARDEAPGKQRGQPTSRRVEEAYGLFRLDASLEESCRAKVASHVPRRDLTVLNDTGGPGPRSEEVRAIERRPMAPVNPRDPSRAWRRRSAASPCRVGDTVASKGRRVAEAQTSAYPESEVLSCQLHEPGMAPHAPCVAIFAWRRTTSIGAVASTDE
jgi:hypothetical protein